MYVGWWMFVVVSGYMLEVQSRLAPFQPWQCTQLSLQNNCFLVWGFSDTILLLSAFQKTNCAVILCPRST